jgi:uncharacterized membrane protein YheB (UPF0754 family)
MGSHIHRTVVHRGGVELGSIAMSQITLPRTNHLRIAYEQISALFREQNNNSLKIALKWHGQSIEQRNHENKLVYLFIALEAVMLGSKERDELQEKISKRTKDFIDEECIEIEDVYKYIKNGYDIRSHLVHGESIPVNKLTLNDKIYNLEDYNHGLHKIVGSVLSKYIREAYDAVMAEQAYKTFTETPDPENNDT